MRTALRQGCVSATVTDFSNSGYAKLRHIETTFVARRDSYSHHLVAWFPNFLTWKLNHVPKVQLLHGDLKAEFYKSKSDPPIFHYIITKQGSATIIAWSQCRSLAECQTQAAETMRYIFGKEIPQLEFAEDDLDVIAM